MGRLRYSEAERVRITAAFLNCTRQIIDQEGMSAITIRRVAQRAGFNSATLYLYFKDLDELITLTCIGYLRTYFDSLSDFGPHPTSARELFCRTWSVFGGLAFEHPEIFLHLFFHPHSLPLSESLARYDALCSGYPELTGAPIPRFLLTGSLPEWNLRLMQPLAEPLGLSEENLRLTGDLMLCYFKKLLEELPDPARKTVPRQQLQHMLDLIDFLLPAE